MIFVLGLYVAIAGPVASTRRTISRGEVKLLGIGTTLGIVAQTVALVPALRRVGFRWRPPSTSSAPRSPKSAGWPAGCPVTSPRRRWRSWSPSRSPTIAANESGRDRYSYAWLLFQIPYAVVGISVITALLPRMSAHAVGRQLRPRPGGLLHRRPARLGDRGAVLAGARRARPAAGPGAVPGARRRACRGTHYMGVVFAVFCLGLLPYMMFQLQLRVFYSLHDSKTPALIGLATMTVNIIANLLALALSATARPGRRARGRLRPGEPAGRLLAWRILSLRLRGLDGWHRPVPGSACTPRRCQPRSIAILVGLLTSNGLHHGDPRRRPSRAALPGDSPGRCASKN